MDLDFKNIKELVDISFNKNKRLIGLNTGCGNRWLMRLWSESNWIKLTRELKERGYEVVLLGGEFEHAKNLRISEASGAIYPG